LITAVPSGSAGVPGRQALAHAAAATPRHVPATKIRPIGSDALPGTDGTPSILPQSVLFGADEASAQPAIASSLGVQWTRIPFIWSYVQQSGPASWNPFVLDAHGSDGVIDREVAAGRNVVGLLLGSPTWAAQYPSFGRASAPINIGQPWSPPASANPTKQKSWPANTNYWANYCYWMAKHYAGRIDYWIIWNEVSIPTAANGAAGQWTQWYAGRTRAQSVHAYVQLLEAASRAIHAANPDAKVVLYGDPYWYDKGAFLAAVLAQLHADDPTNAHDGSFDVANLHLYIGPSTFYWIIGDLRRELARYGWGNKQIWISETNVEPYDDPSHLTAPTQFRVTMDEQAGFLVDAFAIDIAAGVNRIEVYRMFDGAETAHGLPAMGMVSNRIDPTTGQHWVRPVGYTFRFLLQLFQGATGGSYTKGELYPDPLIGGKAGVYTVVISKPGARITVLWNQLGAHPTYTQPFGRTDGVIYDAHDLIVLPLRDPQGVSYDRYATATYHLPAHATTATIYDKFGNALTLHAGQTLTINNRDEHGAMVAETHPTTISLSHGVYTVQLRGGITYSNPSDPRIPTVGGDPVIIVESTGAAL
jgi:hypothetical protein